MLTSCFFVVLFLVFYREAWINTRKPRVSVDVDTCAKYLWKLLDLQVYNAPITFVKASSVMLASRELNRENPFLSRTTIPSRRVKLRVLPPQAADARGGETDGIS